MSSFTIAYRTKLQKQTKDFMIKANWSTLTPPWTCEPRARPYIDLSPYDPYMVLLLISFSVNLKTTVWCSYLVGPLEVEGLHDHKLWNSCLQTEENAEIHSVLKLPARHPMNLDNQNILANITSVRCYKLRKQETTLTIKTSAMCC